MTGSKTQRSVLTTHEQVDMQTRSLVKAKDPCKANLTTATILSTLNALLVNCFYADNIRGRMKDQRIAPLMAFVFYPPFELEKKIGMHEVR